MKPTRSFYFYEDVVPVRVGRYDMLFIARIGSFISYHKLMWLMLNCPATITPKPYYGA